MNSTRRAAALLEDLVRIPSPTGAEAEAVAYLQERAEEDGLRVRRDAVGNFIAEAGHGRRTLLFVGHVDTVAGRIPVRVEDGVLWGRGAVDAKAALVAAYCAARLHLDDPDLRVVVVGAVGEEGDSRGARGLHLDVVPDWIVVGEPSGADAFTIGYRGVLRAEVVFEDDERHTGRPEANACDRLVAFWGGVLARLGSGTGFRALQCRLDGLHSESDGLRQRATARVQVRLPPGADPAAVATFLRPVSEEHGGVLRILDAVPAVAGDARSPLAAAFRATLRARGRGPRMLQKTGTADLNLLAQRWPGVPILAYGPGDAELDHAPDERIPLADLDEAVEVLDGVMQALAAAPVPTPAASATAPFPNAAGVRRIAVAPASKTTG